MDLNVVMVSRSIFNCWFHLSNFPIFFSRRFVPFAYLYKEGLLLQFVFSLIRRNALYFFLLWLSFQELMQHSYRCITDFSPFVLAFLCLVWLQLCSFFEVVFLALFHHYCSHFTRSYNSIRKSKYGFFGLYSGDDISDYSSCSVVIDHEILYMVSLEMKPPHV